MAEKPYLTSEGETKIKSELEELCGPKRAALAKRLRDAIQMGDLSENADYHKAKEDQAFLEGRIQELEFVLRNAIIIPIGMKAKEYVTVGCTVTFQENGSDPESFQIVGAKEADPKTSKISNESPFGQALLGKKPGEFTEVDTPGGKIKLKIIRIE